MVCKSAIQLIWCFEFEASESAIIGVKSDKIVRWISEPMRRIMEVNQSVEISHDGLIYYWLCTLLDRARNKAGGEGLERSEDEVRAWRFCLHDNVCQYDAKHAGVVYCDWCGHNVTVGAWIMRVSRRGVSMLVIMIWMHDFTLNPSWNLKNARITHLWGESNCLGVTFIHVVLHEV